MSISTALAFLFATQVAAAAETPPAACWAPSDLTFHKGEDFVQRGTRKAVIPPPKRDLAEYTPVEQRGAVRRVKLPPGQKLIAITFDLCEQPFEIAGYQGGIVDFLRHNQIKATFFMGGKWTLSHGERAQQLMSDSLFEVGNHSWEHRNLRNLSGQSLIDEIKSAQLAYEQVRSELPANKCVGPDSHNIAQERAAKNLTLFRFPYGACSPPALNEVANLGLTPIQWDVSSGDPTFGMTSAMIKRQVVDHVQPGSIVLFHANGRGWHTEGALPGIVSELKARGYSFVTVSELMAAGEPVMTPTCYDDHPGDMDHFRIAHITPGSGDSRLGKPDGKAANASFAGLFSWLNHPAPSSRSAPASKRSR